MASIAGTILKKPVKIALVQLLSGSDKAANLKHAASQVAKAATGGSKIVVLPECFNSPYGTAYFPKYARNLDSAYHAWGHSMILDPMAAVLAEAQEGEAIVESELSEDTMLEARRNVPLETQRRFDVYPDVSEGQVAYEDPDLLGQVRH
ncbi:hypothetical protein J3F83DRAFT_733696 [Trichoderma novae-zelandiae]